MRDRTILNSIQIVDFLVLTSGGRRRWLRRTVEIDVT
jgi:hypothetical protein